MRIPAPKKALGTVAGVLLPCIQNILGIILFLRLPVREACDAASR